MTYLKGYYAAGDQSQRLPKYICHPPHPPLAKGKSFRWYSLLLQALSQHKSGQFNLAYFSLGYKVQPEHQQAIIETHTHTHTQLYFLLGDNIR